VYDDAQEEEAKHPGLMDQLREKNEKELKRAMPSW
jgi:hypothetical protein